MYIQMYALVLSSPAGSKYNYMVCVWPCKQCTI